MNELKQISKESAFGRMAAICAKREFCVSDIDKKLARYNLSDQDKASIIQQLKTEKYIDEARYARSFIHDKSCFNKWGRVKIRYALLQKSISSDVIDEAFSTFSDTSLSASLIDILHTKSKSVKSGTASEKRYKLIRFALGRGFEIEDIRRCLNEMDL